MAARASCTVLGLDIGIGSLGWCLLDKAQGKIVGGGVHLWDVPQEAKTKVSLAAGRRAARSSRRRLDRAKVRRKRCLNLLREFGLVPENADAGWLQSGKGDAPVLQLRKEGLDRLLTDREFAQVLYSLNAHRGYIPHGEVPSRGQDVDSDDAEGKKVLSAIRQNRDRLAEGGWRTAGEMLAAKERCRNHGGDYEFCVNIDMLVDEVRALFAAQRSLGGEKAGAELMERFVEVMRWEKKSSDYDARVYKTVGKCVYFPDSYAGADDGEYRAATSTLSFEMCRAFEQVNHCVVIHGFGQEAPLPAEIRRWAIETLFSPAPIKGNKDCKVTYGTIRKKMDLPSTARFKGVAFDSEGEKISDPKCWAYLRKALSPDLMVFLRENRTLTDAVCEALTFASNAESLAGRLSELDLTDAQLQELMTLPYSKKLFKGYGKRSLKALDLLIDQFGDYESITTLSKAESSAGLFERRLESPDRGAKLPPYTDFDPTCRNPVVLRSASRVRHMVNAIVAKYGMPDEVHIELARDLKHSAKEKAAIDKANNASRKKANALKAQAAEFVDPDSIKGKLLTKLLLWDEQGERDVYVDQHIDFERMLKDPEYCEVDHILPLSRTCDDSRMNKVLVLRKSNQDKLQRTPYEWLSAEGRWEAFAQRISMDKRIPPKKKEKLLETNLDAELENKFIKRNLNDTRYASRAMMNFIEQYLEFPESGSKSHVVAVAGGATGALRSAWGLRKSREEDDCHHFVDAAVVAACDRGAVQAVAKASAEKRLFDKAERKRLFTRTQPWDGFREEVESFKRKVIPTRMIDHKVSGRLYLDSLYSFKGIDPKSRKALLEKKRAGTPESATASNFVLCEDGKTVKLPDGQAFLRLWWDPEAKVRGRKEAGRFLAEPVYYADLSALKAGTYTPRFIPSSSCARSAWPEVPERARNHHVVIFQGDAIVVNGVVGRYHSIDIATCAWKVHDIRSGKHLKTYGTIAGISSPENIKVLSEDLLGESFEGLLGNSEQQR